MVRFKAGVHRCGWAGPCGYGIGLRRMLIGPALSQVQPRSRSAVNTPALGRLQLENGYPTVATSETLYNPLDLQRATQSYLWPLPAVGFKALYVAQAKTQHVRNGDVLLYRTLQDKAGRLTPNITSLYAFSLWDLAAQGPLEVEVPAGLTPGGVLDIWQQPLTHMGQSGPDKGAGGKSLILPSGPAEVVTPGYRTSPLTAIRSGSAPAARRSIRRRPRPLCVSTASTPGASAPSRH